MAGALAPPAQRRRQDGAKRAPVAARLRVVVVGVLALVAVLFARQQSSRGRFAPERHPLVKEERVVRERAYAPEDERAGGRAGTLVDDSVDGVRVPFYMYPGMANVTSRLLDCLSFGTGLDESDAANTTAWFHGALSSPVAQYMTDVAMFSQMERSSWRTHDPEEASIFYVPVLYALLSMQLTHFRVGSKRLPLTHAPPGLSKCAAFAADAPGEEEPHLCIFQQAVDEMESMPYASRRRGLDHAFTMVYWRDDDRLMVNKERSGNPVAERLFSMLERGIHFAKQFKHAFDDRSTACNVIIPEYGSTRAPKVRLGVWPRATSHAKALHTAYFRGKADHLHDGTYTKVRKKLLRIAESYPEYGWSVTTSDRRTEDGVDCEQSVCSDEQRQETGILPEQMMSDMSRSTFCLIAGGDKPNSQRLQIAISVNCLPVIIARFYDGKGNTFNGDNSEERKDLFFYTPFPDIVDYSSFAVLVDPVWFVLKGDRWLPDRLAAIAANTTLVDAMLLSLSRAARHLTYDESGSDIGNVALLSASRHCLSRPTDRLPTELERRAVRAAGVSWASDDDLNYLYENFTARRGD